MYWRNGNFKKKHGRLKFFRELETLINYYSHLEGEDALSVREIIVVKRTCKDVLKQLSDREEKKEGKGKAKKGAKKKAKKKADDGDR